MRAPTAGNPRLRFPGFADDWQRRRLGEFFSFKNGVNADKARYGRGRKFINVMDVISDQPITHERIIGSVEVSEIEFEKHEVRKGDLLFQRSSETREDVGQSNIYIDDEPATFGGFVIRGRPRIPLESRYFDALTKTDSVRKDMTSRSGGSTRYNIGQDALEAVEISVSTDLAEQQLIGDFLASVDEKLQLLKLYRRTLLQQKSGISRKLLSREVRFTRADGTPYTEWKSLLLGDVAQLSKGKGISKADVVSDGSRPCIRYGELYTTYGEKIDVIKSFAKVLPADHQLSAVGDVILPASGEAPLDMASASCVLLPGVAIGSDINVIRSPIDGLFLAYLLRNAKRRDVARLAQGNSIVHLNNSHLASLRLTVPSDPDEQRMISEFLSSLDDRVAKLSGLIGRTLAFKTGLLQHMFV